MVFNQFLEILKWKFLVSEVDKKTGWREIVESHLGGFSLGSVTPGRIGETFGRALFFPGAKRKSLFVLSLNSSFSIFVSSLILGLIPAFYFVGGSWILVILPLICFAFTLLFLFPQLTEKVFCRMGFSTQLFSLFSTKTQGLILFLSLIRVLVYSIQLSMVLSMSEGFFEKEMLLGISILYYGILTILPSFFLSEIGIRGGAMLILAGICSIDYHHLIAPLSFVWALNVGIPSLAGSALLLRRTH